MKKICFVLLVTLLSSFGVNAQSVGASQIKKKTNAGIVADSANALAIGIYRGTSAPATPVTGQAWLDTNSTPAIMKTYNGSTWEATPSAAAVTKTDLTSYPANPTDGQIAWIKSLKRAIVYDSTAAKWYYLDTQGIVAGTDYSLETAGYSSTFLTGPGATSGSVVAGGSMTTGTHRCAITFYNSTGGETIPGTITASLDTTTNKTIDLTFDSGAGNATGKRVWCSKANTTSPLFLITSINDASTTTYSVTVADGSFLALTAPDDDFSAPLPTGWVVYRPDYSYGGCGSTGISLLCTLYKADIGGSGGMATSGVRLYYPIPAPTANWRAALRITRFVGGFPGFTGVWTASRPIISVTRDYTVVGSLTRSGAAAHPSGVDPTPFSSTNTPSFNMRARAEGSFYASTGNASVQPWPPILGTPFYVQLTMKTEGANFTYRGMVSSNNKDWSGFGRPTDSATSSTLANSAESASTGVVSMAYVGIDLQTTSTAGGGMVYEFDSFTLTAE